MSEHHTLSTTLVHAGRKKRFSQGSVNPVVQRASSVKWKGGQAVTFILVVPQR